ncbi:D-hexose-6-phosphate mutarotase [Reinekea marinisedimentorum]|uniref:Putative glucose-6-phosphate 1-epimerase n=1 Tax=Reinekea marinisedimentorum TaxID=230495 RepID=A0A4R3I326_9GAMM|nr:D-hexose-6-phosphate mutarotase [Reinekea marinisedimentorum]TCS40189.1 glucose-6-phosphate 1-epimerase [Reinekea marinisedimentorum]
MTENIMSENVVLDTLNELPVLRIDNQYATATIAVQGAHLIEYTPLNQDNVIFVSQEENFAKGKAIRGGVPVCWPWFGPNTKEPDAPAHGLVRALDWEYEVVSDTAERTDIRFSYTTTGDQLGFAYKATCELLISIGETLVMSLTTTNNDDKPFEISQALHTYFSCANIDDVRIQGLEDARFLNRLEDKAYDLKGEFCFDQEVDGVVLDKGEPVKLVNLGKEAVTMTRRGSNSMVLWNPWIEKSKSLSNFNDLEYTKMFCVETTNTSEDSRLVKPGNSHVMCMEISTETA